MTDSSASDAAVARERALRMARRLAGEAAAAGIRGPDLSRLLEAYRLAMGPRIDRLQGQDPAFLHPARTALILLADVGTVGGEELAASVLVESEDPELRVEVWRSTEPLGAAVVRIVESVPLPPDDRLLDSLVEADEAVRLLALAERLDQVRHAHLRSGGALRRAYDQALEIYLPVAERTHVELERRYRSWCEATERKLGG